MDVSENSGTPKSSIFIGFSIINHPFWGTPIFGNTHIVGEVGCGGFAMNCVGRVIVFVDLFRFDYLIICRGKFLFKMHISGVQCQCGVVTVHSKRVAGSKLCIYILYFHIFMIIIYNDNKVSHCMYMCMYMCMYTYCKYDRSLCWVPLLDRPFVTYQDFMLNARSSWHRVKNTSKSPEKMQHAP